MTPAPFAALLALAALSACTTFDAGPPPVPRAELEPAQIIVPADIRPLTTDQRDMLDG